jgi:hypothetical protein
VLHDNDIWPRYKQYFDNKINNETYDNRAEFMRTMFNLGGPLNVNETRFKNMRDRSRSQDKYVELYINRTNIAIMEIIGTDGEVDETGMSGGMVNFM